MEAVAPILTVLSYLAVLVLGGVRSYGDMYDRLYRHSGNFPAVGGP
ncbi:MAG: hypothetical protein KJO06_03165 [Gemmatimonadetes bacterium]|nr:hypothetical protein [Gemmatimonadota bacterium]NNK49643.1 hypothetical protein [Gemmatimonadota bacterium]